MANHAITLERLATTFTTRDIMVPEDRLVSATDVEEARRLLQRNPDFDVVPVKSGDALVAYLKRADEALQPIERFEIVSEATSILNLVDHLQARPYYFVLVERDVTGYVHFSDLNNHLVALPFYLLLNAVEERLAGEIRDLVTEDNLAYILGEDSAAKLKCQFDKQRKNDSNLYLADLLYLPQVLKYARRFDKVVLARNKSDALVSVRNKIAHPTRPLVTAEKDISRLAQVHETCTAILSHQSTNNCPEDNVQS